MALTLPRVSRVYRRYTITATTAGGVEATLAGVDMALVAPSTRPDAATVWTPLTYADGVAVVLFAGPDAPHAEAITVPALGADVWLRVVDAPEVDVTFAERITIR